MKLFKKGDIAIVLVLTLAALAIWALLGRGDKAAGARVEIYHRFELVKTVELTKGQSGRFSVEGLENVVFELYEDGSVAFVESDCPDKRCVHTGKLHKNGEIAACLPNRVYMIVTGERDAAMPDLVIGR